MRRLLLGMSALFFALTLKAVGECSCENVMEGEEAFDLALVVVEGKLVDINTNWISGGYKLTFQVDRSWKKKIENFTVINTREVDQCGFSFVEGEKYLVFVQKKFSRFTSACTGTLPADKATAIVAAYPEGIEPGAGENVKQFSILMIILTAAAMLFVLFVVLRKKIFKPKT